ncbi:MAG: hypothetical protein EBX85_03415 [Actinobacteria bacterium]|nr:hypothetical protein [Actinomycetota bacterium]
MLTKVVAGVEQKQELECSLEIEINGDERRAPTGGIEYFNTALLRDCRANGEISTYSTAHQEVFEVPVKVGEVKLSLLYQLNTHGPALSIASQFSQQNGVLVRNLLFNVKVKNVDSQSILNVPGNGLRSKEMVCVAIYPLKHLKIR